MLKKQLRMKWNSQFNSTFKCGKSFHFGHLLLVVNNKKYKKAKIGIVVSKKIGKSVTRNHIKRLIRESIQEYAPQLSGKLDLIFVARQGIEDANYNEVNQTIFELLKKSNALVQ